LDQQHSCHISRDALEKSSVWQGQLQKLTSKNKDGESGRFKSQALVLAESAGIEQSDAPQSSSRNCQACDPKWSVPHYTA
jgi:hypothetical protein